MEFTNSYREAMMASPEFRFVSYDLDSSVEVAEKLWANKNDGSATADELAALLGYKSKSNGAFLTRLANARAFGLLDGPSAALRVSPLARRILHPVYPADKKRALIEAFELVPLFSAFLSKYHGMTLPDETGMRNSLHQHFKIDQAKTAMVLARLLESADQAGLFEAAGSRTKLIRPTLPEGPATPPPATPSNSGSTPVNPPQELVGARHDKLIDGVLDLLPEKSKGWNETGLSAWLQFFENGLRLYYEIPKKREEERSTQ